MSQPESRTTFFKQSGWMALASTLGGLCFMLASLIAFRMPNAEVNIFDTALAALAILGIPALGTQAAFASLAAAADTEESRRRLAALMRAALVGLGSLWAIFAIVCAVAQNRILALFGLSQPVLLWIVVFNALLVLWFPVASGVLQGRQDFLWYGLGTLLNGASRFLVLAIGVFVAGFGAVGGLLGIVAGGLAVLILVMWRTRDTLLATGAKADWSELLKRAVPLTLGLGALVIIMQADALIVREKIQSMGLSQEEIVVYTASRRIAQILVYLVGAVVAVMFPKVSRSFQRTESTEALKLTLALTIGVSLLGATATSLMPQLPLRVLGASVSPESKQLVIAYTWALVPLALCNVLAWNLLAREQYRLVPTLLIIVALAYWWALRRFNDSLLTIIAVVAVAASTLLAVCLALTWLDRKRMRAALIISRKPSVP